MTQAEIVHQQFKGSVEMERSKAEVTPMALLHMAVQQGAAIDTIERLAKLQREMFQAEAEKAFGQAMQSAQSKMKRIGADANNPQTRSKYASFAKLDGALRPTYTDEGFALSFDTGDAPIPETVRVLCYVSHRDGHTRTYKIDMPADGKGAKGGDVMTKTHATGAAVSYGSRYLLKMIFNVAVGESDDDGNLGRALPHEDLAHYKEQIEAARDFNELKKAFANGYKAASAVPDDIAKANIQAAYEKRKAELL